MKKSILKLLVVPAFFLVAASVYAWTDPAVAPPGGNVSAPLRSSGPTGNYLGKFTSTTGGGLLGNSQIFDNGSNVGVGTVSPGAKLDVNGDIKDSGTLYSTTVQTGGNSLNLSGSGWGMNFYIDTDNNSNDNYDFYNNGNASPIMELNGDSGNLGIGTTNPTYRLTLAGSGPIFGIDNQATFLAKNAAGGYENYLWPRWSDNVMYLNYGANGFNIRNNSSVSTIFMDNSNRVGIGKQPAYTLDVAGDVNVSGCFRVSGTCLVSGGGGGGTVGGSGTANAIPIWTNGTTLGNSALTQSGTNILVNGGGQGNWAVFNLPAGGTSIQAGGPIYSYDSFCVGESNGNCAGSGGVVIGKTNGSSATDIPTSGSTYFNNGSNVGIGLTNPSYTLDVNGTVHGSGLNIGSNAVTIDPFGGITVSGGVVNAYSGGLIAVRNGAEGSLAYDRIAQGGTVGVFGRNSSGAYALWCDVGKCGGTQGWNQSSDARLKKNIATVTNGLDKILQLRGVTFNWKDSTLGSDEHLGFIAQEVEKVLPQAVSKGTDGYYTMNYDAVIPVLVESIKDLKAQNDSLEARVSALEAKIK